MNKSDVNFYTDIKVEQNFHIESITKIYPNLQFQKSKLLNFQWNKISCCKYSKTSLFINIIYLIKNLITGTIKQAYNEVPGAGNFTSL